MKAKTRIEHIELIPIAVPFASPFQIAKGGPRSVGEQLIVRLHSNQGLVGVGETQAWRRQGSVETLSGLIAAIKDYLAPCVIGRSPFDLAAISAAMDDALWPAFYAKAPILDALYDLQGKILGVPVYALLGGKCRDGVEACAVLPIKESIDGTLEGARNFWNRGFTSFTVKVGVKPTMEIELVKTLRQTFPLAVIRVDANAVMEFDAALALLKKLEPFEIDAAEQMIAMWNLEGMGELGRHSSIPIMADESVGSIHDLLDIIKCRAATSIQTKVAKNGGIWHMRKLWTLAEAAGMRIYPGNHPSTSIATASVVHLAAAWPGPLLAGPFAVGISGAFARDIVKSPLIIENGRVKVPDAPGLGVELDEIAIREMRVDK